MGGDLRSSITLWRTCCVVPQGYERLPQADVWATLLLWLCSDPKWVLTMANWWTPSGDWNFGAASGIRIKGTTRFSEIGEVRSAELFT